MRSLGFDTDLAALPTQQGRKSKGRQRIKSSSEESDYQLPVFNYVLFNKDVDIVNPLTLFDFIGRQFEDIEDNIIFSKFVVLKSTSILISRSGKEA